MKKISIMLLAALMLFAFVACDDEPKTPEGTAITTEAELREAAGKAGTYYLANDISLTEGEGKGQLHITAKITLDGNGKAITRITPTTGTDKAAKSVILIDGAAGGTTLKNLTVSGTEFKYTGEGEDKVITWNDGEFGIKVYNVKDVTLENVTVTKANAGVQVNSSEVEVAGKITLTGNGFGGIGVLKGEEVAGVTLSAGKLTFADGAEVVCADTKVPAIWRDNKDDGSTVESLTGLKEYTPSASEKKDQVWYFTVTPDSTVVDA